MSRSTVSRMRCATGAHPVRDALRAALGGGPPVAALPADPYERERVVQTLRPDAAITESDTAAVVATSGSTGRPKGVVLSRAAITAAVHATHQRLGGPGSWVVALPVHYVAGLMVLARAVVADTTVAVVDPRLTDLPQALGDLAAPRYLSLVPRQLARALTEPDLLDALGRLDAVLVGGSAPDPVLLQRARDRGILVVVSYGMSETCGGCVYDGVPLDGVDVAIEPATAQISLTGAMVFSGYRLEPALTEQTLQGRTFRTMDRGRWVDGRLQVDGRLDDLVVSGGMNVDLAQVERQVRAWAPDADVAVVGVPDPGWGVEIVAVTDGSGTTEDLRRDLARDLDRYALPRRLVRLERLPKTSSGKIDRRRLVDDLTADAGTVR